MIIDVFRKKIDEKGLFETLKLIPKNVSLLFNLSYLRHLKYLDQEYKFDRKYGVDTASFSPDAMEDGDNFGYQPTRIDLLKKTIRKLTISYKDYIFIDLGSGKGRALMIASNYPFKKIIGIELSSKLHECANRNLNVYQSKSQKCFNIISIYADAVRFPIPDEKAVFYLYNPFSERIINKILSNIQKSFEQYPRKIFIVYVCPKFSKMMDQSQFLELVTFNSGSSMSYGYSIYKTKIN